MKRTVTFVIDGADVEVEECPWDIIEDTIMPILNASAQRAAAVKMLEDQLVEKGVDRTQAAVQASSNAGTPWWTSRGDDIRILAAALRRPYEDVRRSLSLEESRQVSLRIPELLKISGFVTPGEAEAASGSTETSIGSSQA